MSTYNTNYAPPAASNAIPMNQVNGMQTTGVPQQQYQQYQQQQQQILQQKQQQPGSALPPPPQFNSSFPPNKFLPPTSNAVQVPTSSSLGVATPLTATMAPVIPPTLGTQNGAMRQPTGVQSPVSNLPPHLRPPTQNGPTHFNGSVNSSRTASPGLLTAQPPPPTPQTTAQLPMTSAPKIAAQPLTHVGAQRAVGPPTGFNITSTSQPNLVPSNDLVQSNNGPVLPQQKMFAPPVNQVNAQHTSVSGATTLTGSMQNLNIGSERITAGGIQAPTTRPQLPAARASEVGSTASDASDATRQSDISMPTVNDFRGNTMYPHGDTMFQSVVPVNRNAASIFGTPVAPNITPKPNVKTPFSGPLDNRYGGAMQESRPPNLPTGPPPTTAGATPVAPSSQTSNIAAPTPGSSQRKPMYPSQMPPPPIAGQQQQQQQQQQQPQRTQQPYIQNPYAPAYHQPQQQLQQQPANYQQQQPQAINYQQQQAPPTQFQQPQPGVFNGQSNSGPLQYQSQSPQQVSQTSTTAAAQYNQPMNVTNQGFSRLWGQDTIDLMQNRHILSPATLPPPKIVLHNQFHESINCSPSIIRCTVAKIPESNSLLQKSRLPLGILIHPFRDINSLPVIQCPNIVRCRLCRTYINPFVYFVDSKMWKCNLCYRVNELPEDFQFDPATKTYGDVTRRPEVRSSTIEFIAPSEYMLRPPQPAIYLFLFDVSIIAQQSGYLETACSVLNKHLDDLPGDARTQIGFIAYDSYVHFYSMADGFNQPHEMTLLDIDDPFLPRPDSLLVNLKECKELVRDLLGQLPKRFAHTHDPGSALGAALQVAYKLMQSSGGRITVFQTCLPNRGPGALEAREDPNNRSAKDVAHLNPATDFYKRYALECSGYQIAVDLFLMNQQYSDMATISGVSKHSGGCVHHFPLFQKTKNHHVDSFRQCFKRYLTRKIGFEAVMRIRCTRGLQVHTFHGNFFVRSTDLLSLPNVNPDAGYGMQISYEESLTDVKTICFQAALLYTNSDGERRIRVHTLCLPVTASLPEVMHAADTEAIIGLLSKMAVDRSITSNLSDAREAFINATVDVFNAFKIAQNLPAGQSGQLIAPRSLALMPLYILALLKHPAFRVGTSTRLDDRVYAMDCMKTLPLDQLMKFVYPEFYKLDVLFFNAQNSNQQTNDEDDLPDVPRLQLSAEFLDSRSMFLMDCGLQILIYVGLNVPVNVLENSLGIRSTAELPDYYYGLPHVNSAENEALRRFISQLNEEKPFSPMVQVIRDTSTAKSQFIEKFADDRSESSLSYYEFLQHIRAQVK